jgi:hypothetical protein
MKRKVRRFELGGPTSYADSGSAGGSNISFKDAFREARKQGLDTFTWRGKKYTTEMKDKEDKTGAKTESRKMSSEEFVKEYEKSAPSGRMRQEAYYRANPEPSAEAVSPEEAILGPKAKAAVAGAGAAAAGYGLKKARDFLMRRGQQTRSQAEDVMKGSGAMARSAAAREAEAAAYAARIRNAQRSPGMTGYKKGGTIKSSASRRADGIAQRGKTKGRII